MDSRALKVERILIFDDMDAEEGLQVVRLRDRILLFQEVTQLGNELCVAGRNCKVVHVNAEVDALAVIIDLKEQTGIVC